MIANLLAAALLAAPAFGPVHVSRFDGVHDDLLTAGLGLEGLSSRQIPAFADPLHPTASELRRNAIYGNYRGMVDPSPMSGFGRLYGPHGKVAGTEYLTYLDDGSGQMNVSILVQVPDNFDRLKPCVVVGVASGSLGIYGAIASAGEWGLRQRCAVVYTDKGAGIGLYVFDDDTVNLQTGERAGRTAAGKAAIFAPAGTGNLPPHRLAFKYAHSQQHAEKDWGVFTQEAIRFAFITLNGKFNAAYSPANTVVIATGISNGGGAALRAAEQDAVGWISGVVVVEPQVQLQGKPSLLEFSSYAALYQPCLAGSIGRCASLAAQGLLFGWDLSTQQFDALRRLHDYGWPPEADVLHGLYASTAALVAATTANAYGRVSVFESLCDFGFAVTDIAGVPAAFPPEREAASFAVENGIVGKLIYERALDGPRDASFAWSPSSGLPDQALDGFLCLNRLVFQPRFVHGMQAVQASADLHGKPAIIVHGQRDALLPVNLTSRAYLARNQEVEGSHSRLRYIEVANGNHFEWLTSVQPMFVVPLQVYLLDALDAMMDHLRNGRPLPPTQVVQTWTRPNAFLPLTRWHVPPIER